MRTGAWGRRRVAWREPGWRGPGKRWSRGRGAGRRGARPRAAVAVAAVALTAAAAGVAMSPAAVRGQTSQEEAVMVAAARWAAERLPRGALRVDPHRTGQGADQATAARVARAVGADLGTLEDTRRCSDVMDPSTCRLEAVALLAISPPRVDGDAARVHVYAWYRQSEPREPVAKASWELQLRRSGDGWAVVSGG